MNHRRTALLSAVVFAGILSACGSGGSVATTTVPDDGTLHTVDIAMTDLQYDATSIAVAKGATVEFRLTNDGKVPHDAFVGDQAAQDAHEVEMAGMPAGHAHDMGDEGVTVQPGATAVLTYTFERSGTVQIACHQRGHYAAGMHLTVAVA